MNIRYKLYSVLLMMTMMIGMATVIAFAAEGEAETRIPNSPEFTCDAGKIGGLYVSETDREKNSFGGGTRAVVDLRFPAPSQFEADSYTLQYSADNGTSWGNYQNYDEDLTTTGDNFSLNLEGSYLLRLLVNGGPKDGYTSNEVDAPLSNVETRFSGWGLDESMDLTGVIAPYIGRGLEASFSVNKLDAENTAVDGFLTYQWYRVNPATYEMTEIQGATDLTYTTTEADAGYLLLIRATGDGTNAGGFIQVLSQWDNVIPNKASVSNVTNNGFTLNLEKSVDGLTVDDLTLLDKDWNPIQIDSVTPGANQKLFTIAAAIPADSWPLRLSNNSDFWQLIAAETEGHMMEGLEIAKPVPTNPPALSLTYRSASVDSLNKIVTLTFNNNIVNNTNSNDELKGAITIDVDGQGFKALASNDTVSIIENTLVITFVTELPENTKLRIAANTLKSADDKVLEEAVETGPINEVLDECFIATAAYGSKNQTDVVLLRHFRDEFLLTNPLGKLFVQTYYHISPPIAQTIAGHVVLKYITRILLLPLVALVYMIYHPVFLAGILAAVTFLIVQRRRSKEALGHM